MAMDAGEIERLIRTGIPDAQVTIRDLAGDGDHYAATVIAGSVEIVAGTCLLFPRAGAVGAVLVAVLTLGTAGIVAGHAVNQGLTAQQPVGFPFRHTAASSAQI